MKVVITAATMFECIAIQQLIPNQFTQPNNHLQVSYHTSGVGILASTFSLARLFGQQKPDLVIQAGIAGTFDNELLLGTTIVVKDEYLGDTGVVENGDFKDLFDLKLAEADTHPFTQKKLTNPWLKKHNLLQLPEVAGVSVNEVSTDKKRIAQLMAKYKPVIESMEGAPLHYCGLMNERPFIQIRSVSNYVGERNKANWKIKEALQNMATNVHALIEKLANQM